MQLADCLDQVAGKRLDGRLLSLAVQIPLVRESRVRFRDGDFIGKDEDADVSEDRPQVDQPAETTEPTR